MAVSAPAEAAERKLLVLIDASGSMSITRPLEGGGTTTRFEDAKAAAATRINFFAMQGGDPLRVAVYTFQGNNLAPVQYTFGPTSAFVDPNTALDAIDCLTDTPDPVLCAAVPALQFGGVTPLALGMCSAANTLMAAAAPGDAKLMVVASDGLENSTTSPPCAGPFGTFDEVLGQYTPANAWQNNVINHFTGKGIATFVDLFEFQNLPLFVKGSPSPDPEGKLTPEAHLKATRATQPLALTPLQQFFTVLVERTGGALNVIYDDELLPILGDHDGDRCVSRNDAIHLAKSFGPVGSATDGLLDHNGDGSINLADYQAQATIIDRSCSQDPYTVKGPISCRGLSELTISGVAIDGSTAVDVRGSCRLTIKNSLIVGTAALNLLEKGVLKLENSIVIGASAVLSVPSGTPALCAQNTHFKGRTVVKGKLHYLDLGGNIWEQ